MGFMASAAKLAIKTAEQLEAKGKLEEARKQRKSAAGMIGIKFEQPVVFREYRKGKDFEEEAAVFVGLGYEIMGETGEGSHINVGRTATAAVLTGGWSLLLGASRSKSKVKVTYQLKKSVPPQPPAVSLAAPPVTAPTKGLFCTQCGKQNLPDSAFCAFCGARQ